MAFDKHRSRLIPVLLTGTSFCCAAETLGQLAVPAARNNSAGGGQSAGGAFTLTGLIGQPESGTVSIGGDFAVSGGFVLQTRCAADFNGIGGLSIQDIFDFLNAWFAGSPASNFNGTGGVTIQDLFDFLNAWFLGC